MISRPRSPVQINGRHHSYRQMSLCLRSNFNLYVSIDIEFTKKKRKIARSFFGRPCRFLCIACSFTFHFQQQDSSGEAVEPFKNIRTDIYQCYLPCYRHDENVPFYDDEKKSAIYVNKPRQEVLYFQPIFIEPSTGFELVHSMLLILILYIRFCFYFRCIGYI